MKISLIMRKQYQGQLSALMLYYSLFRTGFNDRFFFCAKIIFESEKQKNRNLLRCQFQNGELTRAIANIKLPMFAMLFEAIFTFC